MRVCCLSLGPYLFGHVQFKEEKEDIWEGVYTGPGGGFSMDMDGHVGVLLKAASSWCLHRAG